MIHTDGIRTIADNTPREEREVVVIGWDGASRPIRRYRDELHLPDHRRSVVADHRGGSGAANGQQWNDDACACGNEITDSPAGDKCWECFNFDPS